MRRALATLEGLEGRLWALEPIADVAAVDVFNQVAFGGRHFRVQLRGGVGCMLPAPIRRSARSLRVLMRRDAVLTISKGALTS